MYLSCIQDLQAVTFNTLDQQIYYSDGTCLVWAKITFLEALDQD